MYGDKIIYQCLNNKKVEWCVCKGIQWECIDNPEQLCE